MAAPTATDADAAVTIQGFPALVRAYMADRGCRAAAVSADARRLAQACERWLQDKMAPGAPSPWEMWSACEAALEEPEAEGGAPLVRRDAARAADLLLLLAERFHAGAAHEEAARACLYALRCCPALVAELGEAGVAVPDHGPAGGAAERWRETDFAKAVGLLLDAAVRARLPLGRELGEALVAHRTIRLFRSSVQGQDADGRVPHNVRGALYTAAVLMLERLQNARDCAWLRAAMAEFGLAACDPERSFAGYVNEDAVAARLCAAWKRDGLAPAARRLAAYAAAPQPFRAPTVESVQRLLDMHGKARKGAEHEEVRVCRLPTHPPPVPALAPNRVCCLRQSFWARSVAHLQRDSATAGIFDKPYLVIFVRFGMWRELYSCVGWAFASACGSDGSDYCPLKRTGPAYAEPEGKKRKRDRAASPPLPPVKVASPRDMARMVPALQTYKNDPRQFRNVVQTLLRPAEMLSTVLATKEATKGALLQTIRPLVVATAQLYYAEGFGSDEVLRFCAAPRQLRSSLAPSWLSPRFVCRCQVPRTTRRARTASGRARWPR